MQPECSNAGSKTPDCRMHSLPILLGRQGSPISWRMEERLKWRSGSPDMLTAGQRSSTTAAVRKSWSKIWRGSDTKDLCEISASSPLKSLHCAQRFEILGRVLAKFGNRYAARPTLTKDWLYYLAHRRRIVRAGNLQRLHLSQNVLDIYL